MEYVYLKKGFGGAYMVTWIEFDGLTTLIHEFWHRLCFFFFIKLFSSKKDHIKIFEGWLEHPLKSIYDKFTVLIHYPKIDFRCLGESTNAKT